MSPMSAATFNELYPVGTPVLYWPGARMGEGRPSKTRTPAWELGGHTPVVSVEGYAGGIALTHVEVRSPDDDRPDPAEARSSSQAGLASFVHLRSKPGATRTRS